MTTELRYQLDNLSDPLLDATEKEASLERLSQAGLAAVPLLVARLSQPDAFFLERRWVTAGPLYSGPPQQTATSVCFEIESLLYRLITPPDPSPPLVPGGAPPPVPRFVLNWDDWWRKHQNASLEAIHASSRAAISASQPRFGGLAASAASPLPVPPAPEQPTDEERATYLEARRILSGPNRSAALKALSALRTTSPRVERHLVYFRTLLGR